MNAPCITFTCELTYDDFCRLHYLIAYAHNVYVREMPGALPLAKQFVRSGGYKSGELKTGPWFTKGQDWSLFYLDSLSGTFNMEYAHGIVLRCNRKTKRRLWSVVFSVSYEYFSVREALRYYRVFLSHIRRVPSMRDQVNDIIAVIEVLQQAPH